VTDTDGGSRAAEGSGGDAEDRPDVSASVGDGDGGGEGSDGSDGSGGNVEALPGGGMRFTSPAGDSVTAYSDGPVVATMGVDLGTSEDGTSVVGTTSDQFEVTVQ